uniref:Uncharacterized protein n=1 Tax=Oryza punctata TaxID=4537 RepID=A0A0E0JZB9_ORYPU
MSSAPQPEMMNHRHHAALASVSRRSPSWGSAILQSFGQAEAEDPFRRAQSVQVHDDDEEDLRWGALEKLPTYDRMRRGVVRSTLLLDDDPKDGTDHDSGADKPLIDIRTIAACDTARTFVERLFQDNSEHLMYSTIVVV